MPRNRYYDGPPSDHYDSVRFFNPGQPSTDRSLTAMLRWKLAGGAARWPKSVPVTAARPAPRVAGLRVTMVRHASLLIQAAGINFLTDPIWSARASPFAFAGPSRVTAPGIAFDDLPPIDVVLLSHCHYDHLDVTTLRRLHAAHAPLMAMPLGNDAIVRDAVPAARCVAGDWWDRLPLGDGIATTLTPAYHWANRWPTDVRMALWAGHHVSTPSGSIWFAGDTGYGDGAIFVEMRERLGAPDVALIRSAQPARRHWPQARSASSPRCCGWTSSRIAICAPPRRRSWRGAASCPTARCCSPRAASATVGSARPMRAFVAEVLETFRWHGAATVDRSAYGRLSRAQTPPLSPPWAMTRRRGECTEELKPFVCRDRLVADIVAFPGPHINHLTPRTLDIDRTHTEMARRGMRVKAAIEGPPRRAVPILLRQTSFHALEEAVRFADEPAATGGHSARFGEIEQRGVALTRAGRALYDRLLADAQAEGSGDEATLTEVFRAFPDEAEAMRRARLAHSRYIATDAGRKAAGHRTAAADPDDLVTAGLAVAEPITYEDFLPVSAAGIFRSNLGDGGERESYASHSSQASFEAALGQAVLDPFALYEAEERASIRELHAELGITAAGRGAPDRDDRQRDSS